MNDLRMQIARLEDMMEELSSAAERCRKVSFLSRIVTVAAGTWLIGEMIGLVRGDAAATLIAISAVLFGIVLYGSNRRTWQDISGKLASLEAQRNDLIDEIDLRLIDDHGAPARIAR